MRRGLARTHPVGPADAPSGRAGLRLQFAILATVILVGVAFLLWLLWDAFAGVVTVLSILALLAAL